MKARLLWAVGAAALSIQLGIGIFNLVRTVRVTFSGAPYDVVSGEIRREASFIRQRMPAGAALFYVMQKPEHWQSRLWQRVLYPSPVLILQKVSQLRSLTGNELRLRYDIRYALSVGDPPSDPGFRWHVSFPPQADYPEMWFGELQQ